MALLYHFIFVPVAVIFGILPPKQAFWFAAAGKVGMAFTVTVVVPAVPAQPLTIADTE